MYNLLSDPINTQMSLYRHDHKMECGIYKLLTISFYSRNIKLQ